jgi:hypothetical protein
VRQANGPRVNDPSLHHRRKSFNPFRRDEKSDIHDIYKDEIMDIAFYDAGARLGFGEGGGGSP